MKAIGFRSLAASILLACMSGAAAGEIREVGPKEASGIIGGSRGKAGFVILDIRTPGEFAQERIEGAVNVDFHSPSFRSQLERLDRGATYLLYCRTGNRSGKALKTFRELGFGNVIHLAPGIVKWKDEGYPTVGGR